MDDNKVFDVPETNPDILGKKEFSKEDIEKMLIKDSDNGSVSTPASSGGKERRSIADLLEINGSAEQVKEKQEEKDYEEKNPNHPNITDKLRNISVQNIAPPPIIQNVRTLKTDLADAAKMGKSSIFSIAAREQDKKGMILPPKLDLPEKNKSGLWMKIIFGLSTFLIFAGVTFVLLAKTGVISNIVNNLYEIKNRPNQTATSTPESDDTSTSKRAVPEIINIDGSTESYLREAIISARDNGLNFDGKNKILDIKTGKGTEERMASVSEFFLALNLRASAKLIQSLSKNFTIGFHLTDNKSTGYLLFDVPVYENALAEMFKWEPSLEDDLGKILRPANEMSYPSASDSVSRRRKFRDAIIHNQDTRALYGESGNLLMFYSFVDHGSKLLIVATPETMDEIVREISSKEVTR